MTNILDLAASGKADNVLRDMRVRSLFSPYYLVKVVLGYDKLSPTFHQLEMENFLNRWAAGERKQWIEWSRGFFKSTCFTIGTSIWIVLPFTEEDTTYALEELQIPEDVWFSRVGLHDQDATQLLSFETMDNGKKKVGEIKWHFEENELFRLLFPEIAYTGSESPWNNECLKIRRAGYGRRLPEGTFEAIGVGGALQSRHYRIVWEDDLIGMKATRSPSIMEESIRWHGLLSGAFEDASQQIRFGVSNRWGYHDLNSHIRANEPDFIFHCRSAWETNSEGEDVPTFPERYSLEALFQIRDSGSLTRYDFSCQYMNSPILAGGQEVDISKLHYYTVDDSGGIKCSCGSHYRPSQLLRYLHYDPFNAKGIRSVSCPSIVVIGTSSDKHIFPLDVFTTKGSYKNIFDKIFNWNDKWRPYIFTYEDVGHQNMTEHHIRSMEKTSEHSSKHRRLPTIIPVPTHNKAKEIRIRENLLPYVTGRGGQLSVRKEQLALISQLETFPNERLADDYDILDSLAQGGAKTKDGRVIWRFPVAAEEEETLKQDDEAFMQQLGQSYTLYEARA